MKEIYKNLFVGDDTDCSVCLMNSEFSIIHACKTCHQRALKYKGSLSPVHPNYLIYEYGAHLYLNMVDMSNELLPKYTNPIFKSAISFINREIKDKKVLIHCNQGQSRSQSLGLIYLAINNIITKKSFEEARMEYTKLFPEYAPGTGIMLYMQHNWNYLVNELQEPAHDRQNPANP